MYKVTTDCLILDRGIGENDRFLAVVSDGEELVADDGNATELGKSKIIELMDHEAVAAGATVIASSGCVDGGGDIEKYSDDSVHAFNGGDLVFGDEPIMEFMEKNGLIIDTGDIKVKPPITTAIKIGKAYKQPVQTIVKLLVDDIVNFVITKFKWAKDNEFLLRSLIKLFAGANSVDKYTDKIFTEVQQKLK